MTNRSGCIEKIPYNLRLARRLRHIIHVRLRRASDMESASIYDNGSCHKDAKTSLVTYSLSERSHIILYDVRDTSGIYSAVSFLKAGTLPCRIPFNKTLSSIIFMIDFTGRKTNRHKPFLTQSIDAQHVIKFGTADVQITAKPEKNHQE